MKEMDMEIGAQIMGDITMSFGEAQNLYLKALKASIRAESKLIQAKRLRDDLCPHTVVQNFKDYTHGSYYDPGYSDQWAECACCGLKSDVVRVYDKYCG